MDDGVDDIVFNSKCHPEAGIMAHFNKRIGVLKVMCGKCGCDIMEIAVAEGNDHA
jgi:ribosomal protein S27AE